MSSQPEMPYPEAEGAYPGDETQQRETPRMGQGGGNKHMWVIKVTSMEGKNPEKTNIT